MDRVHRTLVYIGDKPDEELLKNLGNAGWKLVHAISANASTDLPDTPMPALLDLTAGVNKAHIERVEQLSRSAPVAWVALVSRESRDLQDVRDAIATHCFDFVTVPTPYERILNVLSQAVGMEALRFNEDAMPASDALASTMIGSSEVMRALHRAIGKVASTEATVFISGESGTGKELTAQMIHARSARRDMPFIAVNCGAVPHELLHSELFGYERGAFTGATQRKTGRVEEANGGTLFLDEIGDLPSQSQAALLRFIQERKIERLGGIESIDVDVRVITATHVDMQAAVDEGRFRADLFFRLCVLEIKEPPLRIRGKDITELALYALERLRDERVRRIHGFAPDAIVALHNYGWPGNVRELINRVRRAIILSEGKYITAEDLELSDHAANAPDSLREARAAADRRAIEMALFIHKGRVIDAARGLGISRVHLHRLMQEFGMPTRASGEDLHESGDPAQAL
ncbi:Fis family transcriptional regulator [Burkholderia sp. Leaf177]|uniref:sigma-54 dependent transcriptional regulator n=1 Tax=Burkholderia sp. Leaf177 TaxID=1736287 RepID=UPI0006F56D42|nr:sigma-54 dependent transcriptional regulator [Burkholderia sp. Leaf177]KQR74764.1 Fis family transcriptional regulator [Burkholderia sp. Leaf177]